MTDILHQGLGRTLPIHQLCRYNKLRQDAECMAIVVLSMMLMVQT